MANIDSILFPEGHSLPDISPCDHYAGTEKLILKSLEIQTAKTGIFDITCDLEDGAPVGQEAQHRERICEIIASSLNVHKKTGVRLHDFSSPHFDEDLEAVFHNVGNIITHVTVPKTTGILQAREIAQTIKKAASHHKLKKPVPVHLLIETHGAIHDLWEIASLPGIRGLDFGIMDFVSSHYGALTDRCMHSPDQFEHALIVRAKTEIVAACFAHGVIPVHNVTPEFSDTERTFDDALRARTQFGFLRMWSIHPNQIDQIISAFAPDINETNKASEILIAGQKAAWAPIRHNEKLHDRASYRYYWSILKRAKRMGAPLPKETDALFQ